MAIPKRPNIADKEKALERFVQAAPDYRPDKPIREKKTVISIGVRPTLLAQADERAAELGMSRAAFIALAIKHKLEDEKKR
jgi:hypothetical protein